MSLKQEDLGRVCLQESVLPLLDNVLEIFELKRWMQFDPINTPKKNKLMKLYFSLYNSPLYVFAETLLLFNDTSALTKYLSLVERVFDEKTVDSFVADILNKHRPYYSRFKSCEPIRAFILEQINKLEIKLNKYELNRNKLIMHDAKLTEHLRVEEFFKSSKLHMIYYGSYDPLKNCFYSQQSTEEFCTKYSGLGELRKYSAKFTPHSSACGYFVNISKTSDVFNVEIKAYKNKIASYKYFTTNW